jgi:hypothetical protein
VKTLDPIEKSMMEIQYEDYDTWIQNFSLNLRNIWNENSSRDLSKFLSKENTTAIVIGRGPSIDEHKHLDMLANSNFKGSIVCCDGKLIDTLKSGVTPEKFPNFYVVNIDPGSHTAKWFDHPLVFKFGSKIKGIFTTIANPTTVEQARKSGIKIHWMHSLFDYDDGKKSFNYISSLMVRAKSQIAWNTQNQQYTSFSLWARIYHQCNNGTKRYVLTHFYDDTELDGQTPPSLPPYGEKRRQFKPEDGALLLSKTICVKLEGIPISVGFFEFCCLFITPLKIKNSEIT